MKLEDVKNNRPSEEEIERKLRAYLKRHKKSISEAEIEDTVEYISSLFDDEWIEYTVEEGIGSVDTAIKRWFDDTMDIEDWERQNGPLKKNPYPVKSSAGNAGRIEREGDRLVAYSDGDVGFDYIDLNKGDGKIKNWLVDMSNIYRYEIPEDIEEEFLGSSRKVIKSGLDASDVAMKCANILDRYGASHSTPSVENIDGTTYVVFRYYGGKNDTIDQNDDSWDDIYYDVEGVADVGYGYGYGLDGTKFEDSLLIELDKSITSSRKPLKSSKYSNFPYREEVEALREEVRGDIDRLIYKYQEKLGIKTGDTYLDSEDALENILAILDDQYDNR